MKLLKFTVFTFLLIGFTILPAVAAEWPQWRGPERDGQVDASGWPSKIDQDHLKVAWRVDLGPSYSGPIVSKDRVFTTEA